MTSSTGMGWAAGAALLAFLVACGTSAPRKQPATGRDAKASGGTAPAAKPLPPLKPVKAPDGLFAVGRVRSPGALLDRGARLAGGVSWRSLVEARNAKLLDVMDTSAPLDALALLNPDSRSNVPDVHWVLSAPLTSREAALALAREQRLSLTQTPLGHELRLPGKVRCVIARALGPAPARLVCSQREAALESLVPYATRGFVNEDLGESDVAVEARVKPFRLRYSGMLRQLRVLAVPFLVNRFSLENESFDEALTRAAEGVMGEAVHLFEDADSVRLTLSLRKKGDLLLGLAAGFRSEQAWTTRTLLSYRDIQGPPPKVFFQLPGDAQSAAYSRGAKESGWKQLVETLVDLADGALEGMKVPAVTRNRSLRQLRDLDLASASVSASSAAGDGWSVYGIQEPTAKVTGALDALSRLLKDPRLRKALVEARGGDDKQAQAAARRQLPKVTRTLARTRGLPYRSLRYTISGKLPSLLGVVELAAPTPLGPKGGGAAPKKDAKQPEDMVIVVSPGADGWTWLAVGEDPKPLEQRLLDVLGKQVSAQLGERPAVAPLRDMQAVWGGFTTVALFAHGVGSLEWPGMDEKETKRLLGSLPGRGMTPVPFAVSVDEAERRLRFELRVPKAALMDVAGATAVGWSAASGPGAAP